MGKFFITPSGKCSVSKGRRFEAQAPAGSAAEVPAGLSASSFASRRGVPVDAAAWSKPAFARPRCWQEDAGNMLQPLSRSQCQSRRGNRRPGPRRKLEPWEATELKYLKELQQPAVKDSFGASLLDCYLQTSGRVAGAPGKVPEEYPPDKPFTAVAVQDTAEQAEDEDVAIAPHPVLVVEEAEKPSVLQAALAMPLMKDRPIPRALSSLSPRALSASPSSPRAAGLSSPKPASKIAAPLRLPGMKAILPAEGTDTGRSTKSQPSSPARVLSKKRFLSKSNTPIDEPPTPERISDQTSPNTKWKKALSPFFKFLAQPRKKVEEVSQDEAEDFSQKIFSETARASDRLSDTAPTVEMHAKTVGMVDSIQQWLASGKGGKSSRDLGLASPSSLRPVGVILEDSVDKAEKRTIIIMAKQHGLLASEVLDIKRVFDEHVSDGTGEMSRDAFLAFVRKRCQLEQKEVPPHLLGDIPSNQLRLNFEDFVKWTQQTCWTEEMMMPCPLERRIRFLARQQDMRLPDVEKIKDLFYEFDKDRSGKIDEDEFRHMLYKILRVKNESDVPLKRLQRYWREVDVDGSGDITFDEFLSWHKTSFSKNDV